MTWSDGFTLALRSLSRRPARTLLTVIAVALGSGLLVALASIAATADSRIISELGKGGPAAAINVAAAAPDPFNPSADNASAGKQRDLTDATVTKLRSLPGVVAVAPVLALPVYMIPLPPLPPETPPRPQPFDGRPGLPDAFVDTMVGVDINQAADLPVTVVAGRLPAPASVTEVSVTQGYLDRLHLPVASATTVLGTVIELGEPQVQPSGYPRHILGRRIRVVIVGVVSQQVTGGQVLAPMGLVQEDRTWALGGVADDQIPLPASPYTGALVIAASLDSVHQVRAEITASGYSSRAPEQLVGSVQKYLRVVDIVLGAVGLVALVIATLGIANALTAAVREQRRQIATLKAIGAGDGDIARWFVLEALLVGTVGGVIGAAVGFGIAILTGSAVNRYLVEQGIHGIDLGGIPVGILAVGIVGSALLAVIAGVLPALRAARLPAYAALGGGE